MADAGALISGLIVGRHSSETKFYRPEKLPKNSKAIVLTAVLESPT
ncbi:hypothetical protein X759_04385 [Mesorhizobium sp. LSHC420B00]|nr:hypothetical protein X759_04385 [Mesorhizobium sp. LSHC420B00]